MLLKLAKSWKSELFQRKIPSFFSTSLKISTKNELFHTIDDENCDSMAIFAEMLAFSKDFPQVFAYFTRKNRKVQLKMLKLEDFERFVDLLSVHRHELLEKSPDLLNNAETHVRNLMKTSRNPELSRIILKFTLLSCEMSKGSRAFFLETADFLDFSQISPEKLRILYTTSRYLPEIWQKNLQNAVFSNEILQNLAPSAVIDVLFTAASLNFAEKTEFLLGFSRIHGYIGANPSEIIKLLWVFAYFSLRFPRNCEEIGVSWLKSLLNQLTLLDFQRKQQGNRYKRHEIGLFLAKFHEELYKSLWVRDYSISHADFAGAKEQRLSLLQKDVEIILKIMRIPYKAEEKVLEIYALDFFLPEKNVYLEVHGPVHYVNSQRDGRTFLKKQLLEAWGLKVAEIGFEEWYALRGVQAKIAFLIRKIYFLR